ncbi:MAG: DUF305 domain-containing protein [Pelagibacterales bacterium]|nr:DUF305 domain-containing protein [Pelagibacterales bacterium]
MKKIFLIVSIVLLSTVFALSSMHQGGHQNHGDIPFKKSMDKMHKDMIMKSSGNIDIDFLKGMIPHHQGAIDMSEELIKKTKDPQLKAFAEKIIKDQKAEIKQMQEMLKKKEKK